MNKILKIINAMKNNNRVSFIDSMLDASKVFSYSDSAHIQFDLENELRVSKRDLQEYKTEYNDILERFNSIEWLPPTTFSENNSFDIEFPDSLFANSANDNSNTITSLLNPALELEVFNRFAVLEPKEYDFPAVTDLNGIALTNDESQIEYIYQLCELYDLAEKIKRHQYKKSKLTNLIYKVLKKSWLSIIDIRSVIRSIIRFLFKNLDDEHDSFINTLRINKFYQSSLSFA